MILTKLVPVMVIEPPAHILEDKPVTVGAWPCTNAIENMKKKNSEILIKKNEYLFFIFLRIGTRGFTIKNWGFIWIGFRFRVEFKL